jgi:hypothetical protein
MEKLEAELESERQARKAMEGEVESLKSSLRRS